MSGYSGGDIRHSMPTEMPSTGMFPIHGVDRNPVGGDIQILGWDVRLLNAD